MAVEVKTQPALRIGQPERRFEGPYVAGLPGRPNYDVTADRQRFVMITAPDQDEIVELNIKLNWFDELRRLVN